MDFEELKSRIVELRELLRTAGAILVPGQGLEQALSEAEAVADRIKSVRQGSQQAYVDTARAVSVVWSLSETLRPCVSHGLDLNEHLRTITTGSIDYGMPKQPGATNSHYFKDFELELFTASRCILSGLKVSLNPVKNDPSGDLFIESVRGEMKHPDSVNGLERLLRKFNSALYHNNLYGVFVVGLEDLFHMDPQTVFATVDDWRAWLDTRAQEVDTYGKSFLRMAARMKRILATVQIWTIWFQAAGGVRLYREGNSVLLDDRPDVPSEAYEDAAKVATVFNPDYRRWTAIKDWAFGATSEAEQSILRTAVRERAYKIWEGEGRHHGDDVRHWFQAKEALGIPREAEV